MPWTTQRLMQLPPHEQPCMAAVFSWHCGPTSTELTKEELAAIDEVPGSTALLQTLVCDPISPAQPCYKSSTPRWRAMAAPLWQVLEEDLAAQAHLQAQEKPPTWAPGELGAGDLAEHLGLDESMVMSEPLHRWQEHQQTSGNTTRTLLVYGCPSAGQLHGCWMAGCC